MFAERLRLPKVTAYLLVGLLMGPFTAETLPPEVFDYLPKEIFHVISISETHLAFLQPMANLAMALVLFNMGCSFALRNVPPHLRSIARLSVGELSVTFVLVAVGLTLIGERWQAAVMFGVLALATAPATTVLVFKENQSEGPITQYANTLVALNNVVSIILFEVLLVAIMALEGEADSPVMVGLARLVLDFFSSITAGILAGLIVTVGCAFLSRSRWLVLLVAVGTAMLGVCHRFELPYLFTFLVMGTTVANTSGRAKDIVAQLDQLTGLLCVVFFVIHGTEMDIRALMAAGVIGSGYVVLRAAGKYFGVFFAAQRQEGESVKYWLGATLLSQAGAAIALSSIAANRYPELGTHLQDIILGTVIVFEIVGPIMIRQAVIRTGEVPLDQVIHHQETTFVDELNSLVNRLKLAFGFDPWRNRELKSLMIRDLMHHDVRGIPASATFKRVVDFIERSHDDMLPVVDDTGGVVGMISYADLRGEHFDPGLGPLVRAADLALTSFPKLFPDQPAIEAWRELEHTKVDCLPVVSRDRPHRLVGILRRRDVLVYTARGSAAQLPLNDNVEVPPMTVSTPLTDEKSGTGEERNRGN